MKLGLIFDLDGTLVNSLEGITASLNYALERAGMEGHPPEAVRGFIGHGARMLVRNAVSHLGDEPFFERLEQDFKAHYDSAWPTGTFPYPGILNLLEKLQADSYPMAVLSNKPHAFTALIVARLFPGIPFSAVLGQRTGVPHKPDPAGALEIARIFGQTPTDCLLIGDSTVDLETARNAKMFPISVSWGYQDLATLLAAGAETLVNTPEELWEKVHNLERL